MTELIMIISAFLYVGAKASQQLNVVHGKFWRIPVFALIMGLCELGALSIGISDVQENGWTRILVLGLCQAIGATFGCWLAMFSFKKDKFKSDN